MNQIKQHIAVIILLTLSALGVLLAQHYGLFSPVNNGYFDRLVQTIRHSSPHPLQEDVVIVALDEAYINQRSEPLALMHEDLARFLETMATAKPRAVVVDIVLPAKPWRRLQRRDDPDFNYDLVLLQGLLKASRNTPLILAKTWDAAHGRYQEIFQDFVAAAQLGTANQHGVQASSIVCADDDEVIRHFPDNNCLPDRGATPAIVSRTLLQLGRPGTGMSQGLVDFSVGEDFSPIPLQDLLTAPTPALLKQLAGKVVLLGPVLPLEDRHRLPVALVRGKLQETYQPGVVFHAQAIRSMLNGGLVREPPWVASLLLTLTGLVFLLGRSLSVKAAWLLVYVFATATMSWWAYGQRLFLPVAGAWCVALVAYALKSGLDYLLADRERKRIRRSFGGLVSPDVMQAMLMGTINPNTRGEKVYAVVLFSDVRGFTTLSEALPPQQTIALLNDYLGAMTEIIHAHQGAVISFMGDGIMAVFGCPAALPHPEQNALNAAQAMLWHLETFNQAHQDTPLKIGIGIHAGEVMAGNVGSASRFEYTVIGDVVNAASRLEGLTKDLGYPIVCSAAVASRVQVSLADLGSVPVRGRSEMHLFGLKFH